MTATTGTRPSDSTPRDATPALRARGLVKRYGDVVALDDVSLDVDGGVVGLVGPNGAGKSTFFRSVLGLLDLEAGTVEIGGLDVRRRPVEARRLAGYLPEDLELYDRLTGGELLDLVAGLRETDPAPGRDLLVRFGLADRLDVEVGGYSLGMHKKLGIALALLGPPRLALLDEPLNGLDTATMRLLRREIDRLATEGTTVLVSSHVMSFVERVCDRVVVLRDGTVAADASPDELRRETGLADAPFEDVFLRIAVD